jgi:hypothetical protein
METGTDHVVVIRTSKIAVLILTCSMLQLDRCVNGGHAHEQSVTIATGPQVRFSAGCDMAEPHIYTGWINPCLDIYML